MSTTSDKTCNFITRSSSYISSYLFYEGFLVFNIKQNQIRGRLKNRHVSNIPLTVNVHAMTVRLPLSATPATLFSNAWQYRYTRNISYRLWICLELKPSHWFTFVSHKICRCLMMACRMGRLVSNVQHLTNEKLKIWSCSMRFAAKLTYPYSWWIIGRVFILQWV